MIGHMRDATHNMFHTVLKYMYNMTGVDQIEQVRLKHCALLDPIVSELFGISLSQISSAIDNGPHDQTVHNFGTRPHSIFFHCLEYSVSQWQNHHQLGRCRNPYHWR